MIVDAHLDIAYNVLNFGRNYTTPLAETRQREGARLEDVATVSLPEALAGDVGLVFGTLFVAPESGAAISSRVYGTPEEASQQALEQLAVYRALAEREDVMLLETSYDFEALLAARERGEAVQGIVVLMEGADPILVPADAAEWHARGVRIVGPAWTRTRYSGGTHAPGPLTPLGRELMTEMSRARLTLDISHMAEESFWQALELFEGPVIASHSNCRALFQHFRLDRHLSDEMIKALVDREGVIGVVLYNKFLVDGWTLESGREAVGLEAVVRHIDHICQLAGNTRHVAIGSDFDGGFGREAIPRELDSIADLSRIGDALGASGYSQADVTAILGGNWLRKLSEIL